MKCNFIFLKYISNIFNTFHLKNIKLNLNTFNCKKGVIWYLTEKDGYMLVVLPQPQWHSFLSFHRSIRTSNSFNTSSLRNPLSPLSPSNPKPPKPLHPFGNPHMTCHNRDDLVSNPSNIQIPQTFQNPTK